MSPVRIQSLDGMKKEIAVPGVDQIFTVDEVKGVLK